MAFFLLKSMEAARASREADYEEGGGVSRRRGCAGPSIDEPYPSRNVKHGLIRVTRRAGSQHA